MARVMAVKLKSCNNLWASEIIKAKSRIVYQIPYRRVREQRYLAYNMNRYFSYEA